MTAPHVSVVVVAWGEMPLLARCVGALLSSEQVTIDVIVVDNGAAPGALDGLIADPRVQVVRSGENLGFAGGCNLGAEHATGPFVAFVNPDAIVSPAALAALADTLDDAGVGIATARLRLLAEPDLLNSAGGSVHFLGLGWADKFRQPAADEAWPHPVTNASGAAMAMRADTFKELGGFTPELFMYHEDCELSLRVWLAGLRVEFVPAADVWHDYHFSRNAGKMYYLERNRLVIVLTVYQVRTLVLLAPALLALELGMSVLAARQGWTAEKTAGWRWLVANRAWLMAQRRRVQTTRLRSDRDLVPLMSARFDAGQLEMPRMLLPVDWLLGWYWRLVSALV